MGISITRLEKETKKKKKNKLFFRVSHTGNYAGLRIFYIENMSKFTDRAAIKIWAAVTVCMCKLICVFVIRIYDHKAGFVVLGFVNPYQ